MNDSSQSSIAPIKPPMWLLVVAVLAILWNLMGLLAFIMDVSNVESEYNQLAAPIWVTLCYGSAVVFGVIGSVLLCLRRKIALPVLVLSVLGVVGQQSYLYFQTDLMNGSPTMAILPMMVLLIAIALVAIASSAKGNGWLR